MPEFVVASVERQAVLGFLSATTHGRETWVEDGRDGFLASDAALVEGRWHARGDEVWSFEPGDPAAAVAFAPGQVWRVYDIYWGDRVALVLSERPWQRTDFAPTDAVRRSAEGGVWMREVLPGETVEGGLVPGGWDHEHCAICWATIGVGGVAVGYRNEDGEWICETCHHDYVEPKSFGFIPHT